METKLFDFNKPLLDGAGEIVKDPTSNPVRDASLRGILANNLMSSTTNEPMKYFYWALELHKNGKLSLDPPDQTLLLNFIKGCSTMNVLIKGRLSEVILNS